MLILIEHGEVYAPEPIGRTSILIDNDKIIKVGEIDRRALDLLQVEYEVIDAAGRTVMPGIIDPHEHLLGGSGESSLSAQSPMLFLSEIAPNGITTVVGVLGVDTTMKTMAGLLGHVKGLNGEGITARMWSGGYNVPPTTVMGSIRQDILFIDEIVGAGEVAISDRRSLQQEVQRLAKLVLDTHIGGLLTGKAGVTHFHVGEGDSRLKPLRDLLDQFDIDPCWLYPTHITRSRKLLEEAIELARKGSHVDMDTVDPGVYDWVRSYIDKGGPLDKLTISSDSGSSSPKNLIRTIRSCVVDHKMPLEQVLPFVTSNTATILKLPGKGHLAAGCDGDVLVCDNDSLDIIEVIARGKRLVKDGKFVVRENFLESSDRHIHLDGVKE